MSTSNFNSFSNRKNRFIFLDNSKKNESFLDKFQDRALDFLGLDEAVASVDKKTDQERENLKYDVVDTNLKEQEAKVESMISKESVQPTGGGGGSTTKKKQKGKKVELVKNSMDRGGEKLSKDRYLLEAERVKTKSKSALKLLSFMAPKDFESKDDFEKLQFLYEMKDKKYKEVWNESNGFLETLKNTVFLFGMKHFKGTNRGQKLFGFINFSRIWGGKASEIKENFSLSAEDAQEQLEGAKHLHKTLREKPELARKKIQKNYGALKQSFLRISKGKNPVEAKAKLSTAAREFMKESQNLNPKVFREEIKNGKLAGFSTRSKIIRLSINPLIKSVKDRDFSQFKETVKSDEFKQVAKETLIPFIGSKNSLRRLKDGDSDVPLWARRMEFGLDAFCDALFVAGAASTVTGIGAIPGALSMGGSYSVRAVGRFFVKGAINYARKMATKEGIKKTAKQTTKTAFNEVKWQGIFSLGILGAQQFYEKLYPDGVVAKIQTRAFETFLTPEQQAYAEVFGVAPDDL